MTTDNDLIVDDVLSIRFNDESQRVHLPKVLSMLSRGHDIVFERVQAHQESGWFTFLVQVGALAEMRLSKPLDECDEREIGDALRDIGGGAEAFQLVVDDLGKPAFFQPPIPEKTLAEFDGPMTSPSSLDVLVTAKNHDVKMSRIRSPTTEHWVYALVVLQTCEGFLGRGNYGVVRMNGGFSNRPLLSRASSLGWGARFVHDLRAVIASRADMVRRHGFKVSGGFDLTWTLPWDGKASLALSGCDPYFVEICRRIRLTIRAGDCVAYRRATEAARIDSGVTDGNVGDPWVPILRDKAAALTVSSSGFDYRLLHRLLLSGDFERPIAVEASTDSTDTDWLIARALVRGQGKTEGLHERLIPIPPAARRRLFGANQDAHVGERAAQWIDSVSIVQNRILKPALCVYVQGAPEKLQLDDGRVKVVVERHERFVDAVFFGRLFETLDEDDDVAKVAFEREILAEAERLLEMAFGTLPTPIARRLRSIAAAERVFVGAARNRLPHLFANDALPLSEEIPA